MAEALKHGGHRFCFKCGFVATGDETVCPVDGSQFSTMGRDPFIGKTLAGKYEVLEMLGRGGMSVVYKVRHLFMQRLEAMKMLRVELVSDGDALQRFQQESKAVSTLKHPNIITVLDFGLLEDDTPFLSMDYLEGRDLGNLLKEEGVLKPERAVPLFLQLCDALYHAHNRGVIHRDIKPSNIIMTRDSNGEEIPIVVDFGIAKLIGADGATMNKLTSTGQVFGSPLYMSPEQCSSKRADERTDIYSLGCMLYQALSGSPPIQGNNPVETMMRQIQERPRPFSFINPNHNIPSALESCVLKALAKDPEDRYRDMNQFRESLLRSFNVPADRGGAASRIREISSAAARQSGVADGVRPRPLREMVESGTIPTEARLQAARASRGDQLQEEINKERNLSSPVVQIGAAVAVLLVVSCIAMYCLMPSGSQNSGDDEMLETAGKKPGYANPNVANTTEKGEQIAMMPEADSPAGMPATPAPVTESRASSTFDRPAGEELIAALRPKAKARARIADSEFPACWISLEDKLGWDINDDLVSTLGSIQSGRGTAHGVIYRICFRPDYADNLHKLASKAAGQLVENNLATEFSSAKQQDAGPLKNIPVLYQVITHELRDSGKLQKKLSYVIYFKGDDEFQALHIVPGKESNSNTIEFIQRKILPAFHMDAQ